MTQEEKELLLKDLCARLPYGVKCADFVYSDKDDSKIDTIEELEIINGKFQQYKYVNGYAYHPISRIKPYLRPMSSMTFDESLIAKKLNEIEYHDFLNAHHFDYRGLIPTGLALEAPKDMYN